MRILFAGSLPEFYKMVMWHVLKHKYYTCNFAAFSLISILY